MGKATTGALPQDLELARRRFADWRRTRPRIGPIPDVLWALAVKLGAAHGNFRTARALGLDSAKLSRLAQTPPTKTSRKASPPAPPTAATTFVELPRTGTDHGPDCLLEIERGSGSRLRIELRGAALADVATLARHIWECER
jgi:hypothetical protein